MRTVTFILLLVCSVATTAQEHGQTEFRKTARMMCVAAGPKLRESGSNEIVLIMVVDAEGRVASFHSLSPEGLETIKKAAVAMESVRFEPRKKDVLAEAIFGCDEFGTSAHRQ